MGTDSIRLETTASQSEDTGAADGWSIANDRHHYTTAWMTNSGSVYQIEVKGRVVPATNTPATGAPRVKGAETEETEV